MVLRWQNPPQKPHKENITYNPIAKDDRRIPIWIDGTLSKAVHPDPSKRYEELSAFLFDLRNPNKELMNMTRPLLERDPVVFWQGVSFILAIIIIILLNN